MPAVAITPKQKFNRAFIRIYEKSLTNSKIMGRKITHKAVAERLGISTRMWQYMRDDPWSLVSGRALFELVQFLHWSAHDLEALYRPKKEIDPDAA